MESNPTSASKGKTTLKTIFALLILTGALLAQTPTTYTLPAGTVCGNGVQTCNFTTPNGLGHLQTSSGYWTQFQYLSYPGQNPGYNADYCQGYAAWTVADTPDLGPTSRLYTLSCRATDLHDVPSTILIEVHAHSFVYTYPCGSRVRTTCRQTQWLVDPGSFITITK